jgi:hypothetical protein
MKQSGWNPFGMTVFRGRRDYFSGDKANCAKFTTTAVTIVSGPLNYVGANPKSKCHVPQPSK